MTVTVMEYLQDIAKDPTFVPGVILLSFVVFFAVGAVIDLLQGIRKLGL